MVSVVVKRGSDTISVRRTQLSALCTYSSTLQITRARLHSARQLRVIAQYGGNQVLDNMGSQLVVTTLP
jgi:hypothetical protein